MAKERSKEADRRRAGVGPDEELFIPLPRDSTQPLPSKDGKAFWRVPFREYFTEWRKGPNKDARYLRVIPDPPTPEQEAWFKKAHDAAFVYHMTTTKWPMTFAEVYLDVNDYCEQYPDGMFPEGLLVTQYTPTLVRRCLDALVEHGFMEEVDEDHPNFILGASDDL